MNAAMAIQDIWLTNLKALVEKEGGGRKGVRSVADISGLNEEYIHQLATDKPTKSGKVRYPGKEAADKIAAGFANGRPLSWFDSDPEADLLPEDNDLHTKSAMILQALAVVPVELRDSACLNALLALTAHLRATPTIPKPLPRLPDREAPQGS